MNWWSSKHETNSLRREKEKCSLFAFGGVLLGLTLKTQATKNEKEKIIKLGHQENF